MWRNFFLTSGGTSKDSPRPTHMIRYTAGYLLIRAEALSNNTSPGQCSTDINSEFDLNPPGLCAFTALPVAQLHHQQRRAEEESDGIGQDDGQPPEHEK